MSAFSSYPELFLEQGATDGLWRLQTKSGRVIVAAYFSDQQDAERLLTCWNALRKIAFPLAHLDATEEYVKRLEQLRRESVAMAGAA